MWMVWRSAGFRFAAHFGIPWRLTVLSRIGDADIVHVHGIDFFFDFLAATRWLHRKPLVASTHGGFFHTAFARQLKRAFFQTVTRMSVQAYGTIFASSDSDLDLFRPIAARRLVLAANGVDFQKWRDRGSLCPVRTLLYIGRFSSNKNLAALFPVLRALRSIDPSWALVIAGRPWDVTTGRTPGGRRAPYAVTEAVTILDSPSDDEIAAAIGVASYVVSASRHEGFGISIVEGLSAGLIPVLSRIPPFAKLVADAGMGLLTDFEDAPAAAAAIEAQHLTLLQRPAELRSAAVASVDRYSWDTAADIMHGAYVTALGPWLKRLDRCTGPVAMSEENAMKVRHIAVALSAVAASVALLACPAAGRAEENRLLPFWGAPYPAGYVGSEPDCVVVRHVRTKRGPQTVIEERCPSGSPCARLILVFSLTRAPS